MNLNRSNYDLKTDLTIILKERMNLELNMSVVVAYFMERINVRSMIGCVIFLRIAIEVETDY
jgi:hypothetical protein